MSPNSSFVEESQELSGLREDESRQRRIVLQKLREAGILKMKSDENLGIEKEMQRKKKQF